MMDKSTILLELFKVFLQLLVLGFVGGFVTYFYAVTQKNREIKVDLIKQFAGLHGKFLASRYKYNTFYVTWNAQRNPSTHPLPADKRSEERWSLYSQICGLIGEFNSLKPLLSEFFPNTVEELNQIYKIYQMWRRQAGSNLPILQDANAKSDDQMNSLRDYYFQATQKMRKAI